MAIAALVHGVIFSILVFTDVAIDASPRGHVRKHSHHSQPLVAVETRQAPVRVSHPRAAHQDYASNRLVRSDSLKTIGVDRGHRNHASLGQNRTGDIGVTNDKSEDEDEGDGNGGENKDGDEGEGDGNEVKSDENKVVKELVLEVDKVEQALEMQTKQNEIIQTLKEKQDNLEAQMKKLENQTKSQIEKGVVLSNKRNNENDQMEELTATHANIKKQIKTREKKVEDVDKNIEEFANESTNLGRVNKRLLDKIENQTALIVNELANGRNIAESVAKNKTLTTKLENNTRHSARIVQKSKDAAKQRKIHENAIETLKQNEEEIVAQQAKQEDILQTCEERIKENKKKVLRLQALIAKLEVKVKTISTLISAAKSKIRQAEGTVTDGMKVIHADVVKICAAKIGNNRALLCASKVPGICEVVFSQMAGQTCKDRCSGFNFDCEISPKAAACPLVGDNLSSDEEYRLCDETSSTDAALCRCLVPSVTVRALQKDDSLWAESADDEERQMKYSKAPLGRVQIALGFAIVEVIFVVVLVVYIGRTDDAQRCLGLIGLFLAAIASFAMVETISELMDACYDPATASSSIVRAADTDVAFTKASIRFALLLTIHYVFMYVSRSYWPTASVYCALSQFGSFTVAFSGCDLFASLQATDVFRTNAGLSFVLPLIAAFKFFLVIGPSIWWRKDDDPADPWSKHLERSEDIFAAAPIGLMIVQAVRHGSLDYAPHWLRISKSASQWNLATLPLVFLCGIGAIAIPDLEPGTHGDRLASILRQVLCAVMGFSFYGCCIWLVWPGNGLLGQLGGRFYIEEDCETYVANTIICTVVGTVVIAILEAAVKPKLYAEGQRCDWPAGNRLSHVQEWIVFAAVLAWVSWAVSAISDAAGDLTDPVMKPLQNAVVYLIMIFMTVAVWLFYVLPKVGGSASNTESAPASAPAGRRNRAAQPSIAESGDDAADVAVPAEPSPIEASTRRRRG